MRLDTLIFIKELLEAEVETRRKAWKKAGEILLEKEQEAGVERTTPESKIDDNIRLYRNIKETQRIAYSKAYDALEDFMRKEWS